MRLEVIKTKLENILKDYDLTISSIKPKREFGEKILEILLKLVIIFTLFAYNPYLNNKSLEL